MNETDLDTDLHFWTCFLADLGDNTATINPDVVLHCNFRGRYLAGTTPEAEYYGRVACYLILVLIYLVGAFGIVTNLANVCILQKSYKGTSASLKQLLIALAVLDLIACLFGIIAVSSSIIIQENLNRGLVSLQTFKFSNAFYSIGRTGSIFITILVTIERFLVVAFPIKSRLWLSPARSHCYLIVVLILTAIIDLPWILNTTVVKNDYVFDANSTLTNYPYIFQLTTFAKTVIPKVKYGLMFINYVAPFLLLFLFNGLLYKSIFLWNKRRQSLTTNLKTEINAAKMFSVVVLILLLCHSVTVFIYFYARHHQVVHRELYLAQFLAVMFSASTNFCVYFGMGKCFKKEFFRKAEKWTAFRKRKQSSSTVDMQVSTTSQSRNKLSS